MFDLFGKKKRHQDMYDRAFAEYQLGRNNVSLNILESVISEGTIDSKVFTLIGNIYFDKGEFSRAFIFFNKSISIDPKIDSNKSSYIGRELILKMLESGQLIAHVPDMILFFELKHIPQLICDLSSTLAYDFPQLSKDNLDNFKILALEYSIMRISYDKDLVELRAKVPQYIDSTERVSKGECENLILEIRNKINSMSLNSLHVPYYLGRWRDSSTDSRILTLFEIYISPWCKQIINNSECHDFIKYYLFDEDLLETYENLIYIKNFIFRGQGEDDNVLRKFHEGIKNKKDKKNGSEDINVNTNKPSNDIATFLKNNSIKDLINQAYFDSIENRVDKLIKDDRLIIILRALNFFKTIHDSPLTLGNRI